MANQLKSIVGKLNQKKDLEEALPAYVMGAAGCYHRYAKVRLAMEYAMGYEEMAEGLKPYRAAAKDSYQLVHSAMGASCSGDFPEHRREWIEKLLALRSEIMEKMDVLTAYVDCFSLYEYIFNRLQYRFDQMEDKVEDAALIQSIVQFIFASRDNAAINNNIHMVLGQLPVRMAKGKYFDMVKNSLSMYKGGSKAGLEGYLYMFRTSAMLYRPKREGEFFTEFAQVKEELAGLDYGRLDEEQYRFYEAKIREQADKLMELSDIYMNLQQLLNNLLAVLYAEEIMGDERKSLPKEEYADRILRGICSLYTEEDFGVWEQAGEELPTEEEKLEWLMGQFGMLEGVQEEAQEDLYLIEAVLHESILSYGEKIEELGLSAQYGLLPVLEKLMSGSIFVTLEDAALEETAQDSDVEAATKELLEDLEKLFSENGRQMKRAVMAATLEKMPVFFNTAQELADYVSSALSACSDEAEKYAAAKILESMMDME